MRALGAYNMSVGTSLAFEKDAFGELKGVGTFLINLRTLVRNTIEAYAKDDDPTVEEIYVAAKTDLTEIAKWLAESTGPKAIAFTVYYPSYKSLKSLFNKAELVTLETMSAKGKAKYELITKICDRFYKDFPKQVTRNDSTLPVFQGKGLIITHHVVDLTLTPSTTRLRLLESYTGTAKPYTQWFTKLTGGKDLFYMPFNKLTIQVFGDKATNFYNSKIGLKRLVEDLAQSSSWTSGTSFSKVRSDINRLPQSIEKAGLKMLF